MEARKLSFFKAKISTEDLAKALTTMYGAKELLRLEWSNFYTDIDGKYDVQLTSVYKSGTSETGISYEIDLWESYTYEDEQNIQTVLGKQFAISKEMLPYTDGELSFTHVSIKQEDLDTSTGWPKENAVIWLLYGDE